MTIEEFKNLERQEAAKVLLDYIEKEKLATSPVKKKEIEMERETLRKSRGDFWKPDLNDRLRMKEIENKLVQKYMEEEGLSKRKAHEKAKKDIRMMRRNEGLFHKLVEELDIGEKNTLRAAWDSLTWGEIAIGILITVIAAIVSWKLLQPSASNRAALAA